MNCPRDSASRRLDTLDIPFALERARHLDTEDDMRRLIPPFCVVIEEEVVSRTQSAVRFQERRRNALVMHDVPKDLARYRDHELDEKLQPISHPMREPR